MYAPGMNWLNYHHLLYFWTVAREGTIARACLQLHLTQPTISGQLRALENGYKIYVGETEYDSLGVDSPEDLQRASELFERTMVGT